MVSLAYSKTYGILLKLNFCGVHELTCWRLHRWSSWLGGSMVICVLCVCFPAVPFYMNKLAFSLLLKRLQHSEYMHAQNIVFHY